jgi:hypothetical protein
MEPEKDIGLEMADILFSPIYLANYYRVNLETEFFLSITIFRFSVK